MPLIGVQEVHPIGTPESKKDFVGVNGRHSFVKQKPMLRKPARMLFTPEATIQPVAKKPPIVLSPKLQSLVTAIQNPKAGKAFMAALNPKDRLVVKAVLAVFRTKEFSAKFLKRLFLGTKQAEHKQKFFSILLLLAKHIAFSKDRQFSYMLRKRASMILAFSRALKLRRRRRRRKKLGLMPGMFI